MGLTTASTAGDVSPTTRRAGHLFSKSIESQIKKNTTSTNTTQQFPSCSSMRLQKLHLRQCVHSVLVDAHSWPLNAQVTAAAKDKRFIKCIACLQCEFIEI